MHLADASGQREHFLDVLYRANFGSEHSVYDLMHVRELAIESGLDAGEVDAVLADPTAYAEDVREEEADAAALGITGVPFFVIDRTYGISGAQTADVFTDALTRAWADKAPRLAGIGDAEATTCGPDGVCELPVQ